MLETWGFSVTLLLFPTLLMLELKGVRWTSAAVLITEDPEDLLEYVGLGGDAGATGEDIPNPGKEEGALEAGLLPAGEK